MLLRPTPARGSQFSHWRGACQGRAACHVVVKRYTRVIAHFTEVVDPRDVEVRVEGAGTVVSYPAGIRCGDKYMQCEATFKRSSALQLTAAAADGHRFTGWSGDACKGAGPARCEITGDTQTVDVKATFIADDDARSLTVATRGAGIGRVVSEPSGIDCGEVCTASFLRDSRVVLTAIPQEEGSSVRWSDRDCPGATCTVTLASSREIVAQFDKATDLPKKTHELMVSIRGPGSITTEPGGFVCRQSCQNSFAEGTVELTANPLKGHLPEWRKGCADIEGNSCFVPLDRSLTVIVSFTRPTAGPPGPPTTTTETTPTTTTTTPKNTPSPGPTGSEVDP